MIPMLMRHNQEAELALDCLDDVLNHGLHLGGSILGSEDHTAIDQDIKRSAIVTGQGDEKAVTQALPVHSDLYTHWPPRFPGESARTVRVVQPLRRSN